MASAPALEILNASSLSSDALKTATYNMGANGTLGSGTLTSAAVVYTGELTLPEITAANGFHYTGAPEAGKVLVWSDGSAFYSAGTKLSSLPSGTVLTAKYEVPKYTLTIMAGTGGSITTGTSGDYAAGTEINIAAAPSANYSFSQWTSTGGGTFASTISAATTFTMPASAVTITANFTYSGGSGGGKGSGGVTKEEPKIKITLTDKSCTATATMTAATDGSGKATAAVTQSLMNEAVDKAKEEAEKQGNGTSVVVEMAVEATAGTNRVETSIPKDAMALVASGGADALKISTPIASISFDSDALDKIYDEASGEVKITAAKADTSSLTDETKQLVGDRPVFNFSVTSGSDTISEFGGNVTVAVPYTPKESEDRDAIVIYYINAEGKPEAVTNCKYDPATKTVNFTTNHFSKYAVGYNKVSFSDVKARRMV